MATDVQDPQVNSDIPEVTTSIAAWAGNKVHTVVLESGTVVKITLPDLADLLASGHIPQDLVQAALGALKADPDAVVTDTPKEPSKEDQEKRKEFVRQVVAATLVTPKLKPADVDKLPVEDREMLMEFAMRQRDMDAAMRHIGGLHKIATFREARGISGIESLLANL